MIIHGDCLEKLKAMDENSVDSVVTDPPYGLSFMGKKWDYDVPSTDIWREIFRVLKPGAHVLSFGGTRTYHRLAVNIEDAGFEIRDQVQWIYGQGFPKSANINKVCAKMGATCVCEKSSEISEPQVRPVRSPDLSASVDAENKSRQVLHNGLSQQGLSCPVLWPQSKKGVAAGEESSLEGRSDIQAHQGQLHRSEVCEMPDRMDSDGAQGRLHNGASSDHGNTYESPADSDGSGSSQGSQHEEQSSFQPGIFPDKLSAQTCRSCGKPRLAGGIGTALKPANEPICLARKPISEKTVAANVLKHGTGGLNIDGSRIGPPQNTKVKFASNADAKKTMGAFDEWDGSYREENQGRWPANLILDEEAAEMLDEQSGVLKSGSIKKAQYKEGLKNEIYGKFGGFELKEDLQANSGGASRFFYVAKASKKERNAGLEGMPEKESGVKNDSGRGFSEGDPYKKVLNQNHHPTVKPIKLMEYLIRLITPPNGTVLDPFMGSGSTGVAAKNLGFQFIGIEMNEEYVAIADRRIG